MARKKHRVLTVGTGTIGEPLIYLFLGQKNEIEISDVFFHKKTPGEEDVEKIKRIVDHGGVLTVDDDKIGEFVAKGYPKPELFSKAKQAASVIVDCTPFGNQLKQEHYVPLLKERGNQIKGFIAQGSEKGFGKPYAFTINDPALIPAQDIFIQVVSCNTHNYLVIPCALTLQYEGIENIFAIDYCIGRRASDVSEDKGRLGVRLEKYDKATYGNFGSHQAQDAARVLETFISKDKLPRMHSQIMELPTQYMHTPNFRIELKTPIAIDEVKRRLRSNPLIAWTKYCSNNKVFAMARDASDIRGRILNQTVLCEPTLHVAFGNIVYGACFTPQDGNALLSSVAATLWFLNPKNYKEKMKVFEKFLF